MINWNKFKKSLISIFVGGIAFAGGVDLAVTTVDEKVDQLKTEQTSNLLSKGKYKYVPKFLHKDVEIEIHEYVTPKGEVGYQIFKKWKDGETEYSASEGFGPEAVERTWNNIYTPNATSTE